MLKEDRVIEKIILVDGKPVISAKDLAELYGLNENIIVRIIEQRENDFPVDFIIKDRDRYVLTETGVALMLGFLKSDQIAQVNIIILRVFRRIRELFSEYDNGLLLKIAELEKKINDNKDMITRH